jgi:hypothetical protein
MFQVFGKFTLLFTDMMNASWLLLNVICRGNIFSQSDTDYMFVVGANNLSADDH